MSIRQQERESIEARFRREIAPLIDRMRKQFEAEDNALLAMHPGSPTQRRNAAKEI